MRKGEDTSLQYEYKDTVYGKKKRLFDSKERR